MIYADNIVEKNSIVLRNLITNGLNTSTNTWSGALTGYGFYTLSYEVNLTPKHIYYQRCVYKFTTTNQSPTWCAMYLCGGYQRGAEVNNLVANTEYTLSGIAEQYVTTNRINTYGTIYNGNNGAISGVSSYVKNVLTYDVTSLYSALKTKGVVSNYATLKTWCDSNLAHVPRYTNYDVSSLVNDATTKTAVERGAIVSGEFIETDGMQIYSVNDTVRNNTYFDSAANFSVYNNSSNGTVTHTRVTDTTSPFYPEHPYVVKIVTNGTASPGAGGFICYHTAKANGIFVEKFVAKIPVGYNVVPAYNAQGNSPSVTVLGSAAGTGNWQEYTILYKCGSSGSFSTGGHVYLNGSNNTSVTWYVAYCNNCDITGKEYLKGYTALPNKESFNANHMFSREFNCVNLFPNGNGGQQTTALLPAGWSYDTSDYPTSSLCHAKCSFVQPVNAAAGSFNIMAKINPCCQYKISYWVKCKADMSSFLTAIRYYLSNGTELTDWQVPYINGTKTYLTAALTSGATTVTVANNANWKAVSYSILAFRSGTEVSWHDKGAWNPSGSNGIITGITGSNTINLRTAWTGSTMPSGTYVVEGQQGSTRPYPIGKGNLPTDNTWKYVEGYFGVANQIWDGNSSPGYWGGIPFDTSYINLFLNIYSNNGTVPIKYADIKIEPIAGSGAHRCDYKIQIGK